MGAAVSGGFRRDTTRAPSKQYYSIDFFDLIMQVYSLVGTNECGQIPARSMRMRSYQASCAG